MIWVYACVLLSYGIKRCVTDVAAGSKIAVNHILQQCVAVTGLFYQWYISTNTRFWISGIINQCT